MRKAFTLIELPVVRKRAKSPERRACRQAGIRRAFTLIELLIVIAIIGILATLIFVNVNTARKKARDAKRMADLKNLQTAIEMYAQESGNYPTTSGWSVSSAGNPTLISGIAPTYIGSFPVAPLIGTAGYYYAYNGNGTDYKLLACKYEAEPVNSTNTFINPVAPTDCYQVSSSETSRSWAR